MIKQTINQAVTLLRQNPLLSTISILGTALAISMIMAMVITWQTKYADMEPEVNRHRCLYVRSMGIVGKGENKFQNYSMSSPAFMKEIIEPIGKIEAVTSVTPAWAVLASTTDGKERAKVDYLRTDGNFWKVFQFQFLEGKGFEDTDRSNEWGAIVISASVARKLFGTTHVVGQTMLINRDPMRITGVVKDVSLTASNAYAQVWVLYNPSAKEPPKNSSGWSGNYVNIILAHSEEDFPAIREEFNRRLKAFNDVQTEMSIEMMEQPDDIYAHVNRVWSNVQPDMTMIYLQYLIALIIILLVPSLNLCGLSNSRMQQRMSELGVRKAFGATKGSLIWQVMNENLVLSVMGGLAGLFFSYAAVYAMRTWLFTNSRNVGASGEFSLSVEALFSPTVFLLAALFCIVMNVLSAGIPAWSAARRTIVESLNDK